MIGQRLAGVRGQWRENRRLRLAVLVVLVILGVQALGVIGKWSAAAAERQLADMKLRERLDLIGAQPEWLDRADEAEAELDLMQRQMLTVASAGQAQAEVHAWLSEFAKSGGVADPTIKVEQVLDVPGQPALVQVLARLEGKLPAFGHAAVVRGVSWGLPWIQAERLEVGEQARVNLVVRSYYRRGAGYSASPEGIQ
jgi:hypothetical protein